MGPTITLTGLPAPPIRILMHRMDDAREQPRVDAHGIRPPDAYAIELREAADGVALVVLEGELDLAAVPELRERLAEAGGAGPRGVVLDMAEVTFVDSSALRELLRAALRGPRRRRGARARGRRPGGRPPVRADPHDRDAGADADRRAGAQAARRAALSSSSSSPARA